MKKFLKAIPVLGVAALALASCGEKGPQEEDLSALNGEYNITVWVSETKGVKELTEQQIDAFEEKHPGIVINATVEGVTEADSATNMITSVEDGADLFCFAQDQLARLVEASALNKLGEGAAKTVTELNDAGAVAAAKVAGQLYCYPMTSDNGYFMYYDKSVVKAEHLNSLEDIIADCEAANKMFSMELETSAWYNAAFFFATGCKSNWTTDAKGEFASVDDDFNSDAGVVALKGMQKLLKSKAYNSSSSTSDFAAAVPSAVVISGTWGSSGAKEALGANYAAAKLPSFTVDGKTYQLGSFSGNKLMGCKPSTDAKKNSVLSKLALWLTNEENQLKRFDLVGWGPSNIEAQKDEKVKSDVALAALAAQSPYATPQGQIHGSWWDIAKTYATAAKTATTDNELKDALKSYKDSIDALFSMSAEEKRAWTVIGGMNSEAWGVDHAMTESPEGTWISEAITFAAGDEFKVRQGKAWDVSIGGAEGNFKVENAGTYKVKLVLNADGKTGTITLVAA